MLSVGSISYGLFSLVCSVIIFSGTSSYSDLLNFSVYIKVIACLIVHFCGYQFLRYILKSSEVMQKMSFLDILLFLTFEPIYISYKQKGKLKSEIEMVASLM